MIISEIKYCIASKDFPLKFCDKNGNETHRFNHYLLMNSEEAEHELSIFDDPEEFQILKVEVSYEF